MRPIFKTEMLFFQSRTNFYEKHLFGKISDLLDPAIRKMLVNGKFWIEDSTFHHGQSFTRLAPSLFRDISALRNIVTSAGA